MFPDNRLNDFALHANPAAVDDPNFPEASLDGLVKVFLYHYLDFAWLEGMEVDGVFDRNMMHERLIPLLMRVITHLTDQYHSQVCSRGLQPAFRSAIMLHV